MIFSSMSDSHDRHIGRIQERIAKDGLSPVFQEEIHRAPLFTNFNLVGIRRRLNNVEVGVWSIVALLVLNTYRHW